MVSGTLVGVDGLDSLVPFWVEGAQGAWRCSCVTRHHRFGCSYGPHGRGSKSIGPRIFGKLQDFRQSGAAFSRSELRKARGATRHVVQCKSRAIRVSGDSF